MKVHVYSLGPLEPLNRPSPSVISTRTKQFSSPSELGEPVETDVYLWSAPVTWLVPELWSYEVFVRDNAWKWVSPEEDNESYAEVDRRREMNGIIRESAEKAIEESVLN